MSSTWFLIGLNVGFILGVIVGSVGVVVCSLVAYHKLLKGEK